MPVIQLNFTEQVKAFIEGLNTTMLSSISEHGILPYEAIPKKVTVNSIFGISEVVCVNYVDFRGKNLSETDKNHALETAIFEEYMGIFGISLERMHRLDITNISSPVDVQLKQRLISNIVFILAPPSTNIGFNAPVHGSTNGGLMNLAYRSIKYGNKADGFSQDRGVLLSHPTVKGDSRLVTEVKTHKHFKPTDILYALVPRELMRMASKFLCINGLEKVSLIPVDYTEMTLRKIPHILAINHQQGLEGEISCPIPDYKKAIETEVLPRHPHFSIHAVRLTTENDITPRFVASLVDSQALIEKINAKVIQENADGSGWIVHNKKFSFKHSKEMLETYKASPNLEKVFNACLQHNLLADSITAMKGNFDLKRMPVTKLPSTRVKGLIASGLHVIEFGGYYFFNAPAGYTEDKIFAEADKAALHNAAIKIQSYFRMFRIKQRYHSYKESCEKITTVKKVVSDAEKTLEKAKEELLVVQGAAEKAKVACLQLSQR